MQAGKALLVDVRTRFEHEYVGRVPDTPLVEWKALGSTTPNPQFIEQLRSLEPDHERNVLVYLVWSTHALSRDGSPFNSISAVPIDAH